MIASASPELRLQACVIKLGAVLLSHEETILHVNRSHQLFAILTQALVISSYPPPAGKHNGTLLFREVTAETFGNCNPGIDYHVT